MITFMNPAMLWWLTALIPLAALFILKIRAVRKYTSTWFLWEKVLNQRKTSALFRRLRDIFSLLLMMLAVAAAVLAMAQPRFKTGETVKDLVLIIDNSASMNAKDGMGTRFSHACDAAVDLLKGLPLDKRVIIATAGSELRYIVNRTSNQRELIEGVNSISPTVLPFKRECLKPFLSEDGGASSNKKFRAVLISDGAFEGADKLHGIELMKIGAPEDNAGIVAFDLMRLPGGQNQMGLFFQLASSYKKDISLDVELRHFNNSGHISPADLKKQNDNSELIKVCAVTLKPGLNKPETYLVDDSTPGNWMLKISTSDALSADNAAFGTVPEYDPVKCGIRSGENALFLLRCIQAFSDDRAFIELTDSTPDLILSNGCQLSGSVPYRIIFNPEGNYHFWKKIENKKQDSPGVKILIKDHPSIRFADLENIIFAGQKKITPPDDALIIAEADDGTPLIYKASYKDEKAYVVNMDPMDSEFFLDVCFPILTYSMIRDLSGKNNTPQFSYPTGERVSLTHSEEENTDHTIVTPSGNSINIKSEFFGPLEEIGCYSVTSGKKKSAFSASLFSVDDTLLNSKAEENLKPIDRGWPLSYWLLIFALCITAVESMLYHRRKVG